MKSYLVTGLDEAQQKRLKEAGVEFYEWEKAVLIEQPQLTSLLNVLNATATESPSDYENVVLLKLTCRKDDAQPHKAARSAELAFSRAAYINVCGARIKEQLSQAAGVFSSRREALPPLTRRFVDLTRLSYFGGSSLPGSQRRQEFLDELERLRALPRVTDVQVIKGAVLVYTDTLYGLSPTTGRRHELGQFLIYIHMDGRGGGVRWFNSSRRLNGVRPNMNAPNVYEDGSCCTDEMNQTFLELIARCEFSVVAELAIQFVETVNDDQIGKHIESWPAA